VLRRDEGGASLVEFALVAPLLLLLLFGVADFGRFIAASSAINSASREGARYGSAVGLNPAGTTPRYVDCAGVRDAAKAKAIIVDLGDSDITIAYDTGPGGVIIADCDAANDPTPPGPSTIESDDGYVATKNRIAVTVTNTFQPITPIVGNFVGSVTLSSTDARTIFKGPIGG
jgi:Flp pilus assembly protein TadG